MVRTTTVGFRKALFGMPGPILALLAGACQDSAAPFDPTADDPDTPADTIAIAGTISTAAGGRV